MLVTVLFQILSVNNDSIRISSKILVTLRHLGRREFSSVICVKSRLLTPLPVIARAVKSPLHGPG